MGNENKTNKLFKFLLDWDDNSIVKLKWKSPNDKKSNLFDFLVDFGNNNDMIIRDFH